MAESFPAKLAAHYAGLKTRMMLDYLERAGVFEREELRNSKRSKSHHGLRRKYTYRDIIVLRALSALLQKGVSVQRIREAMITFSRDEKFACDRNRIRHGTDPVQYFITDGVSIFFSKGDTLIDMIKGGQGAFSFVVDLRQASEDAANLIPVETRVRRGVARG